MEILILVVLVSIWVYARISRPRRIIHVKTRVNTRKAWGEW